MNLSEICISGDQCSSVAFVLSKLAQLGNEIGYVVAKELSMEKSVKELNVIWSRDGTILNIIMKRQYSTKQYWYW